jgi:hypothetical protein
VDNSVDEVDNSAFSQAKMLETECFHVNVTCFVFEQTKFGKKISLGIRGKFGL